MWGGSDGGDHVAREVLQHGVANRGSPGDRPCRIGKTMLHFRFSFFRNGKRGIVSK